MGKASRRRKAGHDSADDAQRSRRERPEPVPFVARPFEGLAGETDWVAMREILPAATAVVMLSGPAAPAGAATEVTVATVLPMAWPGLHRADGTVFVGTQSGSSTGDASRDLAASILGVVGLEPGNPLTAAVQPTAASPRLQDLVDAAAPLEVTVHEGFDFWIGDTELDSEAQESLDRANSSLVPTVKMGAAPSAYWCRIGERTHIRYVLPQDEDAATDALTRLMSSGRAGLGGTTRLLGAFRAGGLLVPVWDLDPEVGSDAYEEELAAFTARYADALADDSPLTGEQRRARAGLLSRQVTLR